MSLVSSAIQGWPPLPKSLSGLIKFNREATSKESAGVKKGKATLERQQRHPSKASGGSGGGFFFSPRPMSLQQQQQVSTQEHLQRQQRERQEREAKARRTSMAEKQKQLAMELKAARVDQPPRSCQARTASQIKSLSLDGTARSSKGTRSFATLRPPQPRIIDGLAVAKDGRRPVRLSSPQGGPITVASGKGASNVASERCQEKENLQKQQQRSQPRHQKSLTPLSPPSFSSLLQSNHTSSRPEQSVVNTSGGIESRSSSNQVVEVRAMDAVDIAGEGTKQLLALHRSGDGSTSTELDANLAALRKEMVGLRQMDVELISQLWAIGEEMQKVRRELEEACSVRMPAKARPLLEEEEEEREELQLLKVEEGETDGDM